MPPRLNSLDIIGDVHGCYEEFRALLLALGYQIGEAGSYSSDTLPEFFHPEGRKLIMVGDLVDRGPDPIGVLWLALAGRRSGILQATRGNHDDKLLRALQGRQVVRNHGLSDTMAAIEAADPALKTLIRAFLEETPSHVWLREEGLAVAHAGIKEEMLGKHSKDVMAFCLYGQVGQGKTPNGYPIREDWASDYKGETVIVHGHTPMAAPRSLNNVICIDTGCCFGGSLTAFRWPEMSFIQVPARKTYSAAAPLHP